MNIAKNNKDILKKITIDKNGNQKRIYLNRKNLFVCEMIFRKKNKKPFFQRIENYFL